MQTNRISAAVLVPLLLASSMIACGDAAPTTDTPKTTEAFSDTQQTEAAAEPTEYQKPEVDYGGETFTISAIDYYTTGGSDTWRASDYCEVFSYEENGEPLNDAIYQRNQIVSELLNITPELHSLDGPSAISSLKKYIQAGEDVVDFELMFGSNLKGIIDSEMLVDLNDLPNVDFSHSWWDQNSRAEMTIGDSMYAVTGDISLYISYAPIVCFFSKTIVNTLSLPDPYALVREGKWTLDAMISMSKDASGDLNGDGKMEVAVDRYGMMCEGESLPRSVLAFGGNFTSKDSDNIPYIDIDVDRASEISERMSAFMNDTSTTMLSNRITGYGNVFFELFLNALKEDRGLFFSNQLLVAMDLRDMDTDFGILPQPKLDEAQEDYACTIAPCWGTFVIVPITNSCPEMTGHVLEAMGYYGQQLLTPAYIDTTVRSKTLRDEESSEMVDLILSHRVYDIAEFYDWGSIYSMFTSLATNPSSKFASSYAKIEKRIQKTFDKSIETILES